MGSYPTVAILFSSFFFFIFLFFKANKLRNNYIMMQICVLGPNELRVNFCTCVFVCACTIVTIVCGRILCTCTTHCPLYIRQLVAGHSSELSISKCDEGFQIEHLGTYMHIHIRTQCKVRVTFTMSFGHS